MNHESGVYQICNTVNGKVYVGQAIDIQKRWWQHQYYLRMGTHHNEPLQRAYKKYGESALEFEILETIDLYNKDVLSVLEKSWIYGLRSSEKQFGYNLSTGGDTNAGYKHTDEWRANMSEIMKGRSPTEEVRKRISKTLFGRKLEKSRVDKMIGKKNPKSYFEKMRAINEAKGILEYPAFGESLTLYQWAVRFNINPRTLSLRVLKRGMTLEKAIKKPVTKSPILSAFGKTQTVNDWAREYGMNHSTLRRRVFIAGLSLEDALAKPILKFGE